MRQEIHGIQNHPEKTVLDEYSTSTPEGTFRVSLNHYAWGKSANLLCYFTEINTGHLYRLSVFHNNNYKPHKSDIAFDQEKIGNEFEIIIGLSKNGLPKFMEATRI